MAEQFNYTYMKLCLDVYAGNNETFGNWERLQVNCDFTNGSGNDLNKYTASSGFAAAAYKNTSTGEIVIAYRGMEILSQDALVAWNLYDDPDDFSHQQFDDANTFYEAVRDQYCKNPDGSYDLSKLSLTGHSLGGALAELVGATIEAGTNGVHKYAA